MTRLRELLEWPIDDEHVGLTMDWKGFDHSIPATYIKIAFDIVWSTYRFKNSKKKFKYKRIFDYIVEYFINTRIMLGDGTVFLKNHGIPSGSAFTQLIGSIVNILSTRTLLRLQQISAMKDRYLGDDSYSYFWRD